MGTLFPEKVRVVMPYSDIQTRTTSGGVSFNGLDYALRINSAFDPDFTTGGHKPMGWNQWTDFYDYYYVQSAVVSLKVANTGTTNDFGGWMSMHMNNATTPDWSTATFPYTAMERARGPSIGAKIKHFSAMGGGNSQWIFMSGQYYPRRVLQYVPDEEQLTPVSSNPANGAYVHIHLRTPQSATAKGFYMETMIYQTVIFMQPAVLLTS